MEIIIGFCLDALDGLARLSNPLCLLRDSEHRPQKRQRCGHTQGTADHVKASQRFNRRRVSAPANSTGVAVSFLFVGRIPSIVYGQLARMRAAPR